MIKSNKHIEIVRTTQKGLSSMSKVSCDAIVDALSKHYEDVGVTIVNNLTDLESLVESRPDLVFLGMKYIPSNPLLAFADANKIWLADYFDEHDIAYTGSGQISHVTELNKNLAKQCVMRANLKTSASRVIKQDQNITRTDLPLHFPLFIKPSAGGGGQGIDSDSVVHNFEQAKSKIQSVMSALNTDVLVEEYLPGREFSVAILKDGVTAEYLTMPIELIAPLDNNGNRLLSSQVKFANTEQGIEVTSPTLWSEITELALGVFIALGARDYGRIDIRLDSYGTPHFLEANLIPSLISGYGSFPKACVLNIDLDYEPMIVRIAELGLARQTSPNENNLDPILIDDVASPLFEVALDKL